MMGSEMVVSLNPVYLHGLEGKTWQVVVIVVVVELRIRSFGLDCILGVLLMYKQHLLLSC